ncbi:MAG: carboxypeptidase-like regulatory domain-containing protein [Bacteroidota bacterium]
MNPFLLFLFLMILTLEITYAQTVSLKGRVVDDLSNAAIARAKIRIEGSTLSRTTDADGWFDFSGAQLPMGEQVVLVEAPDYITQRIQVVLNRDSSVLLDPILLELDLPNIQSSIGLISLTDDQVSNDDGILSQSPNWLQASRDVFQNAAAFDFSAAFFRPRGLDSRYGKLLINGIEMNSLDQGRPNWNIWGGLNDVQRNREFAMGLAANEYAFGDVAGTTHITMRPSGYRPGGRINLAAANRTYQGRVMGSFHSGPQRNGWAFSLSMARRFGDRGFVDGTPYQSSSFFISVEKQISQVFSLDITAFYTPLVRGRAGSLTEEVRTLKGIRYNPNWGYQNGKIRNSREQSLSVPVFQINGYWKPTTSFQLEAHAAYQIGTLNNSRLDNNGNRLVTVADGQSFFAGGARDPLGNYYQRLPSYFLRNTDPTAYDYQLAYQALKEFQSNGQLDWYALYAANTDAQGKPKLATYIVQNDVSEHRKISGSLYCRLELNERFRWNGSVQYQALQGEYYAEVADLLGSSGYLDIDSFTQAASGDAGNELRTSAAQSDLQQPNRIALRDERYKYNYGMDVNELVAWTQLQLRLIDFDGYLGARVAQSRYQRTGMYENGNFPGDQSFGPSDALSFSTYGVKGGGTYNLTPKHYVNFNAAYQTKAPVLIRSFVNPRQSNEIVEGISPERVRNLDLSYLFRSNSFSARITGYVLDIL